MARRFIRPFARPFALLLPVLLSAAYLVLIVELDRQAADVAGSNPHAVVMVSYAESARLISDLLTAGVPATALIGLDADCFRAAKRDDRPGRHRIGHGRSTDVGEPVRIEWYWNTQ